MVWLALCQYETQTPLLVCLNLFWKKTAVTFDDILYSRPEILSSCSSFQVGPELFFVLLLEGNDVSWVLRW